MADGSGRDPWQDVSDLVVRHWRVPGSAQESQHFRSRAPAFLMADQGKVDLARSLFDSRRRRGYTGN
jgi:hypothetical protein